MFESALVELAEKTGYKHIKSLEFLYYLVWYVAPKAVLELGTGCGCSTSFMSKVLPPDSMLVSIDSYAVWDRSLVEENIKNCGVVDKIHLIQGSTFDSANLLEKNGLNIHPQIVFMDASHKRIGLHKEYGGICSILPRYHIIVIDDLFDSDVMDFVMDKMWQYEFCTIIKDFHVGMAVICTNKEYLGNIADAIKDVQ